MAWGWARGSRLGIALKSSPVFARVEVFDVVFCHHRVPVKRPSCSEYGLSRSPCVQASARPIVMSYLFNWDIRGAFGQLGQFHGARFGASNGCVWNVGRDHLGARGEQ
jgi:hypothetical protein